jgi:hypothetical protein
LVGAGIGRKEFVVIERIVSAGVWILKLHIFDDVAIAFELA